MASDNTSHHGAAATHAADAHGHGHDDHGHGHGHDDHDIPWIRQYVFSTDHKVIGVQYGLTALTFLFLGFCMIMLMRIPIAYGGANAEMPGIVAKIVGYTHMTADQYNMYGAMHGTIMVFLAVVPLGFAAFGNYFVPLQIGAIDMAFPRLNMWSFWLQFMGACIFFGSFFVPGGAAKSGWTSYPPLAGIQDNPMLDAFKANHIFFNGQTLWLLGMVFLITASLLGAVNFITTVIQLRAPGMTWMRMPYLTWAMFVTAFLLLLAFPPLEAAGIMQLMDRTLGTSFFMPSGLNVNGGFTDDAHAWAGGGSPLLYQHLFWFLGHPEVYVLLLPSLGVATEIIACNTRKPIWGYKSMVFGTLALGFLSFIVWAHHMYLTGMGSKVSAFFQTTTMIISIPSVILLTCLFISLWGGSMRYNSAMLFATAFIPMFGMGGLTGLPLGFNATDLMLHDTYYVIGHFHYMLAPGILFGIFGGIYHFFPKITGRHLNEFWGKVHFWGSFPLINCIFFPMLIQGMAGMHRRMFDGGATYEGLLTQPVVFHWTPLDLNVFISWSVWLMGAFQVPFILNFFFSIFAGKKVTSDNPWHATTLEWQTPTPPPHGNFTQEIIVYRECYEYSVPGASKDYTPQNEKPAGAELEGEKPLEASSHLAAAH
jgi:cytochrome c oxidase subunit 1